MFPTSFFFKNVGFPGSCKVRGLGVKLGGLSNVKPTHEPTTARIAPPRDSSLKQKETSCVAIFGKLVVPGENGHLM